MRKENKEAIEIDLKRLLLILWHRLWIILLAALVVAAVAVGYAKLFVAPTYSASAQFYVNNTYSNASGFSSSQLVAAQDLAYTYMVILKSRSVLGEVSKDVDLGYSYGEIREMVTTNAVNGTEVFQVTVTCKDYKHAAKIADSITQILPKRIAEVVKDSSVRVVDQAVENPNPVGPSYREYALIGGFVGALVSMLIVFVADLSDTTVTSEDYLTAVYAGVPLLAVIPGTENPKTGYYKGYYESQQPKQPARKSGGGK